ncbi:leucine-rich repeat-containing protein 15-like [Chironomus tepperi]|uniref:leucine-rich repeat-containing protein 15-like n=1 Tax=Chironomus tepperi TaxID=113505 RepID=UPI00391F173D
MTQKPQQLIQTSTMYLALFISLSPHLCTQQHIITSQPHLNITPTPIPATCTYLYNYDNIYTCNLQVPQPVSMTDILEITGTHLENHTDADVEGVQFLVKLNTTFNGDVLRKFENLKNLEISGRNIHKINPNAFDVCPKLERLIISSGFLRTLPSGLLKNCENLVYFESMSQSLETFPEDFFGSAKNLEVFSVPFNKLTFLPEKLFLNMQKLRKLSLGYNNLQELSSNFLINCSNLEEVTLYVNDFQDQSDITFALNGHPNLRHLSINDNNFTNFDFRFFSQFQKLEYLEIGMQPVTKLTNIHWQALPASLTELRVMEIDEEVPANAFERLVNLKSLRLIGTGNEKLYKDIFKPLTSLVSLSFTFTGLQALDPDLFSSQASLSNLVISNTQIKELPAGLFVPLVNIGHVNKYNGIEVSSSNLARLNANSFGLHPHLQSIDFNGNDINGIEHELFSRFHPNLTFVNFRGNKCVDDLLWGENLDPNEMLEQCFKNWMERN